MLNQDHRGKNAARFHATLLRHRAQPYTLQDVERMRSALIAGECSPEKFREALEPLRNRRELTSHAEDALTDNLFDALTGLQDPPRPSKTRPFMHGHVTCPLPRLISALSRAPLGPEDVLCDIGAGIGRVPLFVHLWTGLKTYGIEIDSALTEFGGAALRRLNISGVELQNRDAQVSDLSFANVFFLFQPCHGFVLENVLRQLEQVAQQKPIKLWWIGMQHLSRQAIPWLKWSFVPTLANEAVAFAESC